MFKKVPNKNRDNYQKNYSKSPMEVICKLMKSIQENKPTCEQDGLTFKEITSNENGIVTYEVEFNGELMEFSTKLNRIEMMTGLFCMGTPRNHWTEKQMMRIMLTEATHDLDEKGLF